MKIYDLDIPKEDALKEYNRLIDILYSILGNFEDCQKINVYTPFLTQCSRVSIQMLGMYKILGITNFLEINSVLVGMWEKKDVTHGQVRTMIFHCINLIEKLKQEVLNE